MIKALAPGWSRAGWRVILALALGGSWPLLAIAQRGSDETKKSTKGAAAKEKDAEPADDKEEPPAAETPKGPAVGARGEEEKKKAAVDVTQVQKGEPLEIWKDPNAERVLKENFPALPPPRPPLTAAEITAVNNMAANQAQMNPDLIRKYLNNYAADLTQPANVKALADPEQGLAANAKKIEEATNRLAQPLATANAIRYNQFRTTYVRELVPVVQNLLKNNFYARLEGMIVLSRSGDSNAIPLFAEALRDKDQVMSVKERAAVGIALVSQHGRSDVDPSQATIAAQALAQFLQNEPNAWWPVQVRALEALGSLRMANPPANPQRADFATVALRMLADPKLKPDVRAAAAWALGMMRMERVSSKVNFALLGHHVGQDAVDLGNRIIAADADGRLLRARHFDRLVLQLMEALNGDTSIGNAGLLKSSHPGAAAARATLEQIDRLVRGLAQSALDLDRAPAERAVVTKKGATPTKSARARMRDDVQARVDELKSFLAKNRPADWSLIPGGPEFRGPQPQVAAGARTSKP
jgi:hypothetical protein